MRKIKYILYWLIPSVLLCLCGYNLVNAIWIYFIESDHLERLDGYAYLITAIIFGVFHVLFAAVAVALTVFSHRKDTLKSGE